MTTHIFLIKAGNSLISNDSIFNLELPLIRNFLSLQQTKVVIAVYLCSVFVTDLASSNPIQQSKQNKINVTKQDSPKSIQPIPSNTATSKPDLKLKSIPVSNNGAFGLMNMINKNGIAHNHNQKVDKKKKQQKPRVKTMEVQVTPKTEALSCSCMNSEKTTEAPFVFINGVKLNTLFSSGNWGHNK